MLLRPHQGWGCVSGFCTAALRGVRPQMGVTVTHGGGGWGRQALRWGGGQRPCHLSPAVLSSIQPSPLAPQPRGPSCWLWKCVWAGLEFRCPWRARAVLECPAEGSGGRAPRPLEDLGSSPCLSCLQGLSFSSGEAGLRCLSVFPSPPSSSLSCPTERTEERKNQILREIELQCWHRAPAVTPVPGKTKTRTGEAGSLL